MGLRALAPQRLRTRPDLAPGIGLPPGAGGAPRRVATVVAVGFCVLAGGLLLAGLAVTELGGPMAWVRTGDRRLAAWIAGHRTAALDWLNSGFSSLADTWTVLAGATGAAVVLAAQALRRRLTFLLVGLSLEFVVFLTVNLAVSRARPQVSAGALPSTGSFPSGHIAVAVVLYGGLALVVRSLTAGRRVRTAAVVVGVTVPVAVGLSRLYFGLHYPSDVLAGAALGLGSLAVACRAARCVGGDPDGRELPAVRR